MSIQLNIIEKRLAAVENALTFLTDALHASFPTSGVSFQSIGDSLRDVGDEVERYKAETVSARREKFFKHHTTIGYDDLRFLIRRYVPLLAENEGCDRVEKIPSSMHSGDAYRLDLSNLCIEATEGAIANPAAYSRSLLMFVNIGTSIDVRIQETVTMDMETITYGIPYDQLIIPLAKHRLVNWFYDQLSRDKAIPEGTWTLPKPTRGDHDDRLTLHERRLHVGNGLLTQLIPLAEKLRDMMRSQDTVSYGVNLHTVDKNDQYLLMHAYVLGSDDGSEPFAGLRIHRRPCPFDRKPGASVGMVAIDPTQDVSQYEDFINQAQNLPLETVAVISEALRRLTEDEVDASNTTIRLNDIPHRVEWVVGDRRS